MHIDLYCYGISNFVPKFSFLNSLYVNCSFHYITWNNLPTLLEQFLSKNCSIDDKYTLNS